LYKLSNLDQVQLWQPQKQGIPYTKMVITEAARLVLLVSLSVDVHEHETH